MCISKVLRHRVTGYRVEEKRAALVINIFTCLQLKDSYFSVICLVVSAILVAVHTKLRGWLAVESAI